MTAIAALRNPGVGTEYSAPQQAHTQVHHSHTRGNDDVATWHALRLRAERMITLPDLCVDVPSDTDVFVRQLATRALERSVAATLVDAMVYGGQVVLTGRVASAIARTEAERAVAAVPGVRGIVNRIDVASAGKTHARWTERILRWPRRR